MKTIAIDQSYQNFAFVVFDEQGRVEYRDVIHTGAKVSSNLEKEYGEYFDTIQEQLLYIMSSFEGVVQKYSPCRLVFEGLAFGAKGDRVFALGGLFYYLTTDLVNRGLIEIENIHTVAPTSVKKIARNCLDLSDQYERDKNGNVIYLKSKKPKLKKMDKADMLKALQNTSDKWIVEGFSASSKKIPTGVKDLPDSYWIGKAFLEKA